MEFHVLKLWYRPTLEVHGYISLGEEAGVFLLRTTLRDNTTVL